MGQYFLSIKAFFVTAVAMTALLALASGCGGSDSSNASAGGEITVETGSLSKAEFIERADKICETSQKQVIQEFFAYIKVNKRPSSKAGQEAWMGKLVDDVLVPNYEERIAEISDVGAPEGDEEKVAAFLNAIQERLGEVQEKPNELNTNPEPWAKPIKLATAYGFTVCAQAFG